MLNLSDKDLDRLSQEAAQHHEPGDIIGPRLWEKLELRLDRDLGKISPNPARGIRRLPFYFAPAILMLLGVAYYVVRLNNKSNKGMPSASPPLTLIKPAGAGAINPSSSSQNPDQSNKPNSTLTAPSNTVPYPGTTSTPGASVAPATASAPAPSRAPGAPQNAASPSITSPTTLTPAQSGSSAAARSFIAGNSTTGNNTPGNSVAGPTRRHGRNHNLLTSFGSTAVTPANSKEGAPANSTADAAINPTAGTPGSPTGSASQKSQRELTLSRVQHPNRLTHAVSISDSALRAFTLNSIPRQPITRKGGLHINRSLEFGLLGAPDFSSVNSVAGDKAGSSIGLTVDYKFASHWYLGTGLLFTRKNFGAAPENYHVPSDYYRQNSMNNVQYIKGRFDMLEIPLNLRYDFSTTGNTLFFASVGASSYLRTSENCSYYYDFYGSLNSKQFRYSDKSEYLFSALNLSVGAETGISNSLSLLIAPYVKIPTRNIGFGQVELSSFGINFVLKFAPVLSRKR